MRDFAGWRVVIHNDQVNSFAVVVHLVQTLCGLAFEDAMRVASEVHHHGSSEVAVFPEQYGAERMVVALQRRGLDAMVRI